MDSFDLDENLALPSGTKTFLAVGGRVFSPFAGSTLVDMVNEEEIWRRVAVFEGEEVLKLSMRTD
jgi:hypothetical protein